MAFTDKDVFIRQWIASNNQIEEQNIAPLANSVAAFDDSKDPISLSLITDATTAFVSASGDDGTAQIGHPLKPYLTAQAAYDDIVAAANGNYRIHLGVGSFGGIACGVTAWPTGSKTVAITGVGTSVSLLGGITSEGAALNIISDRNCNLGAISTKENSVATGGSVTLSYCYTNTVDTWGTSVGGAITMTDCVATVLRTGVNNTGTIGTTPTGGNATLTRCVVTTVSVGGTSTGGALTATNCYASGLYSRSSTSSGVSGTITANSCHITSSIISYGYAGGGAVTLSNCYYGTVSSGASNSGNGGVIERRIFPFFNAVKPYNLFEKCAVLIGQIGIDCRRLSLVILRFIFNLRLSCFGLP